MRGKRCFCRIARSAMAGMRRAQGPGTVLAVKGADHGIAIVGLPTAVDITSPGKKARRAAKVWPVNVSALKSELYGWLRLDMPTGESGDPFPPGFCHFPQLGEEFFRQLTAEQLITKLVKGYRRTEWQKGAGAERGIGHPNLCSHSRIAVWNRPISRAAL